MNKIIPSVLLCDVGDDSTPHSRLSCSSSGAWIPCTAKIAFEESIPEKPWKANRFSAEGTAAHKLFEVCIEEGLDPSEYAGTVIKADGFNFTVDQDMIDAVAVATGYIYSTVESYDIHGFHMPTVETEVYCKLDMLGIPGMEGGTTDIKMVSKEERQIIVVDYKHGKGVVVEADGNTQMRMYALGIMIAIYEEITEHKFQLLDDVRELMSEWEISNVIIQPRASHPSGPIRTEQLTGGEILDWAESELIPAGEAIISGDTEFNPGEKQCRWCKGFGQCSATADKLAEAAMLDFDALPDVTKPKLPEVDKLTPEQKTFILLNEKLLINFMEAVRAQVQHEVEAGSDGYKDHLKIVRKNTNRVLEEDAFDEVGSPLWDHLNESDMFVRKPKGITAIEDLLTRKLKETRGHKTLKAAKVDAREIMDSVTFKPIGDTILVPLSDKRKEVQATIKEEFSDC